jgi:phasin family protein
MRYTFLVCCSAAGVFLLFNCMEGIAVNTNILATLTEQSKRSMAPVQKLNTIAIANTEKLVVFQMESLQKYAELGLAQWRAAAQVNDPESFIAYVCAQGRRMTEIGEQVIADTKQAYQMGMDLLSEAQKVTQENVASVTKMSKEKAVSPKAAA